jgi:N6-L-threonylcarbamoyladenine synthase
VVPEIAARAHVDALDGIIERAMKEAGTALRSSAVAAAAGPGLIGGVIVGLTTAKAIAMVHDTPLIAVNHLEAHALTPRLTARWRFPIACFSPPAATPRSSRAGVGKYVRLGTTVDDAMGEAFDKVAKMLGLPYPGGPEVERAARWRSQTLCLSAADARTAGCEFLAVGIEDRGARRSGGGMARRRSCERCQRFRS